MVTICFLNSADHKSWKTNKAFLATGSSSTITPEPTDAHIDLKWQRSIFQQPTPLIPPPLHPHSCQSPLGASGDLSFSPVGVLSCRLWSSPASLQRSLQPGMWGSQEKLLQTWVLKWGLQPPASDPLQILVGCADFPWILIPGLGPRNFILTSFLGHS